MIGARSRIVTALRSIALLSIALLSTALLLASCTVRNQPEAAGAASPGRVSSYAPGQLTLLVEPDQSIDPIYSLIASAHAHLDLTMYELVDTDAALALEQAAARGVTVRVVLDANRERAANQPAFDELAAMGVQVAWADPRYAATHQKTLVIDRSAALVMSLNLTSRYYPDTRDFGILDRNTADVAAIEQVFDADFAHTKAPPVVGTGLIWSPGQSGPALLSLIDAAGSSLLVENEEMAYSPVTSALIRAAYRGVRVTVIMTDQTQWHDAFADLVAAHVVVRVYSQNASLYIHAKVIVADAGTPRQRAFMGSENFSAASLNHNRELGLLTTDKAVVLGLVTALDDDAAGAQAWRSSA